MAKYTTSSKNTTSKKTSTSKKTNTTKATTTKPKGVDQSVWDKATSPYTNSNELNKLYDESNSTYNNAKDILSKKDIIDQSVYDTLKTPFKTSDAFNEAWNSLNAQSQALQSGKTSWTDQYNDAMNKYLNREDFEYDVDKDPLFQQALASAMNSGKSAMQDTIGQASDLTGGYGSTYATSAGNQAYNAFIEDAYNNLPEYYNMALQAHQADGQELANQVALLSDADATEFQKMLSAYEINASNVEQMYNMEFNAWNASQNQAYNLGNLQLSEYGQLASNAVNLYDMASSRYESKYAKEYQSWSDSINQYMNIASTQNTDWWNRTNFNAKYTSDDNGGYKPKGNDNGENWTQSEYNNAKAKYESGGEEALANYVETIGKQQGWSTTTIDNLIDSVMSGGNTTSSNDMTSKDFWLNAEITKFEDTINWFGGSDDYDDKVKINGKEYSLSTIHEYLKKAGFDGKTQDKFIKKLSELDENEVYTLGTLMN